jgi:hypothetical protein
MTTGSEVATWLRAVGYTRIVQVTFDTQPQYEVGCGMMEEANGYLGRDFWVLLLIDKDLLYSHSQNDWVSMYPNHWIIMDTPLSPSGRDRHTHVSLRCWTLGTMMDIPADRGNPLERHNFIHKCYGYVAAHL